MGSITKVQGFVFGLALVSSVVSLKTRLKDTIGSAPDDLGSRIGQNIPPPPTPVTPGQDVQTSMPGMIGQDVPTPPPPEVSEDNGPEGSVPQAGDVTSRQSTALSQDFATTVKTNEPVVPEFDEISISNPNQQNTSRRSSPQPPSTSASPSTDNMNLPSFDGLTDASTEDLWMGMKKPEFCMQEHMSCKGRCTDPGDLSRLDYISLNIKGSYLTSTYYCKCDFFCNFLGDCCQDVFETCSGIIYAEDILTWIQSSMGPLIGPPQQPDDIGYITLYDLYGTCTKLTAYNTNFRKIETHAFIIDRCSEIYYSSWPNLPIKEYCEDGPDRGAFSFPVSHRWMPNIVFKNVYCAMCHGFDLEDIRFWDVHSFCYNTNALKDIKPPSFFYDFLDSLEDAETSPCSLLTLPVIPDSVSLRTCREDSNTLKCTDSFVDETFDSEFPFPDINRDMYSPTAIKALCESYEMSVSYLNTAFKNPHCIVCGHYNVSDITEHIYCTTMLENQLDLPFQTHIGWFTYVNGMFTWQLFFGPNTDVQYYRHNPDCYSRSAIFAFFDDCPPLACTMDMDFIDVYSLKDWQLSCVLEERGYHGPYTNYLEKSSANMEYSKIQVFLSARHISSSDSVLNFLQELEDVYLEILAEYSQSDIRPHFYKLDASVSRLDDDERFYFMFGIDRQENFLDFARLLHLTVQRVNDKHFNSSKGPPLDSDGIFFTNSDDLPRCTTDSREVTYFYVPMVVHNFVPYVYIEDIECFIELEMVSAHIRIIDVDPSTFDPTYHVWSVLVCVPPEMEEFCSFSFGPTPEKEVPPLNDGCDSTSKSMDSSSTEGTIPERSQYTEKLTGTFTSDTVTDDFNTICFSFSAVSIAVSMIIELLSKHVTSPSTWPYCLSKIALMVLAILYAISEKIYDVAGYAMGVISHLVWLLAAFFSLLYAGCNIKQGGPIRKAKYYMKFALVTVASCGTVVAICFGADQDDESAVGYTSKSGHVFWMTTETACYINLVALVTFGATFAFILNIVTIIRKKKSNGFTSGSTDNKAGYDNTLGGPVVHQNMIPNGGLLLMVIIGVVDYNQAPGDKLWHQLFALSMFSTGLTLLIITLVTTMGIAQGKETKHRSQYNIYEDLGAPKETAVETVSGHVNTLTNIYDETDGPK